MDGRIEGHMYMLKIDHRSSLKLDQERNSSRRHFKLLSPLVVVLLFIVLVLVIIIVIVIV
jgi:hypothetical protein